MADIYQDEIDDTRFIDGVKQAGMAGVPLRRMNAEAAAPTQLRPDEAREIARTARINRRIKNALDVSRVNPTMYGAPDGTNLGRINPADIQGAQFNQAPQAASTPPPTASTPPPAAAPAAEPAARPGVGRRVADAAKAAAARATSAARGGVESAAPRVQAAVDAVRNPGATLKGAASTALRETPNYLKGAATKGLGAGATVLRKFGPYVSGALEAKDVYDVAMDKDSSGVDVVDQAVSGAGRLAAAGLGAEAGAAVGAFGGPFAPVTVPVGAVLGGAAGYMIGDKGLREINKLSGGDGLTPEDRRLQREAAKAGATPAASNSPWSKPAVLDRPEDYGFDKPSNLPAEPEVDPYAIQRRDPTKFQTQGLQRMDGTLDSAQVANRGGAQGAVIQDPAQKENAKRKLAYDLQDISRSGMQMKEKRLMMQGMLDQYKQETGNDFTAEENAKKRAQDVMEMNAKIDEANANRRYNASKFGKEFDYEQGKYNNTLQWDQEKTGTALDWDKEKVDRGESLKRRELDMNFAGDTAKARAEYAKAQAAAAEKAQEQAQKIADLRYQQLTNAGKTDVEAQQMIAEESLARREDPTLSTYGANGYQSMRAQLAGRINQGTGFFERGVSGDSFMPFRDEPLKPGVEPDFSQAQVSSDTGLKGVGRFLNDLTGTEGATERVQFANDTGGFTGGYFTPAEVNRIRLLQHREDQLKHR